MEECLSNRLIAATYHARAATWRKLAKNPSLALSVAAQVGHDWHLQQQATLASAADTKTCDSGARAERVTSAAETTGMKYFLLTPAVTGSVKRLPLTESAAEEPPHYWLADDITLSRKGS